MTFCLGVAEAKLANNMSEPVGINKVANRVGHRAENLLFVQRIGRVLRIVPVLFP